MLICIHLKGQGTFSLEVNKTLGLQIMLDPRYAKKLNVITESRNLYCSLSLCDK